MNARNGWSRLCSMVLAAFAIAAVGPPPCARAATNVLKGYVGGSVGHANLRAADSSLFASPGSGSFELGQTAFQLTAGIRALEVLGAEVDYFDLGSGRASASWSGVGTLSDVHMSQRGEAAFGVLYLPLPLLDVYVKAGVARLRTELSSTLTIPICQPGYGCPLFCPVGISCSSPLVENGAIAKTDTSFAAGAGVQWKLGNWAIRGEYERFSALGEHPDLVSLGVIWSFL